MKTGTVWKYPLKIEPAQKVAMPRPLGSFSVQVQHGDVMLWALVDANEPDVEIAIEMYGTGHEIKNPKGLGFIGTVQLHGGSLVFHVFERVS